MLRKLIFTAALAAPLLLRTIPCLADGEYGVIKLEGAVNPIIAEHIVHSIVEAEEKKHRFIVIQMDTPGGLMTSMQEIIKGIMGSRIPVIVYAYPKGAQAASAGGYIMLSAHIAAMAPGSRIGAMHPVNILEQFSRKDPDAGSKTSIMERKLLNDSIAYARSLAQKRNRNQSWAERAVRDAISSTYSEALRERVIDIVAEDMDDLLRRIDGRKIAMDGGDVTISVSGLRPHEFRMNWKQRFLNFVADPQIVFFLFVIAVIGIGMEMKTPGIIFPGVIGVISFFVFLMAVRILPINIAGLLLIATAIVLFVLELKFTSYGLFTLGGILSFLVGAMILFDSPLPGFSIPLSTIITMIIVLLAFVFLVVRAVVRVHSARVSTGYDGMIGETARAMNDFSDGRGKISVHGEIWTARASDTDSAIMKNDILTVESVDGMVMSVKKKTQ